MTNSCGLLGVFRESLDIDGHPTSSRRWAVHTRGPHALSSCTSPFPPPPAIPPPPRTKRARCQRELKNALIITHLPPSPDPSSALSSDAAYSPGDAAYPRRCRLTPAMPSDADDDAVLAMEGVLWRRNVGGERTVRRYQTNWYVFIIRQDARPPQAYRDRSLRRPCLRGYRLPAAASQASLQW